MWRSQVFGGTGVVSIVLSSYKICLIYLYYTLALDPEPVCAMQVLTYLAFCNTQILKIDGLTADGANNNM